MLRAVQQRQFEMSSEVSVTRRNCSDRWPTSPKTQTPGPFGRTVSTCIGSLNSGPVRICPSRMCISVDNGGLPALSHCYGFRFFPVLDEPRLESSPSSLNMKPCGKWTSAAGAPESPHPTHHRLKYRALKLSAPIHLQAYPIIRACLGRTTNTTPSGLTGRPRLTVFAYWACGP